MSIWFMSNQHFFKVKKHKGFVDIWLRTKKIVDNVRILEIHGDFLLVKVKWLLVWSQRDQSHNYTLNTWRVKKWITNKCTHVFQGKSNFQCNWRKYATWFSKKWVPFLGLLQSSTMNVKLVDNFEAWRMM